MVSLTITRFSEKMLISPRCIHGFMSNLIKNSWTESIIPKIHVIFQEDIEEEDLVMATTEEAMADMKIEEIETNQAATLILADAIEEIQTGDLLLKMILERPPQVNRKKKSRSINV